MLFQTVTDCVKYYYASKKRENYKQLLRKQNVKKRKFRPAVSKDLILFPYALLLYITHFYTFLIDVFIHLYLFEIVIHA